ncbi:MAG: ATP-binding protein [Actinomycetaceae bacterium]|nr:ATP-binding protein [Actinomycetaceae bacterium]
MRRRAYLIVTWVVVVATCFGAIGIASCSYFLWRNTVTNVHNQALTIANVIDQRAADGQDLPIGLIENRVLSSPYPIHVRLEVDGRVIKKGEEPQGERISYTVVGASGAEVTVQMRRFDVVVRVAFVVGAGVVAIALTSAIAAGIARRYSRKLSAPLIYLAAAAEQLGAGQARPRMKRSGIEEIDLVYEELERTAERMAGRIAAERQFAADASHQLRTPLTALSMRLEEIEYLSDQEEVREEAASCLEQVERLAGVVSDLLTASRAVVPGTEAVPLRKLFEQQKDEWNRAFKKAGRALVFEGEEGLAVLASPGSLAQILATLIENSLKYGEGATRVAARKVGKGVVVDVSDEGKGISEDLTEAIFTKGVSTGGSTGIGLPLARSLAESAGGRLELTQASPPVFRVALSAVPRSLDPDKILPSGSIIAMGARRRR